MIRSIRLVNWRSHQDSRLEFSKGTNLLVGIMGAGKSLPYSELVLVKDGIWRKRKIGDVVESALSSCKKPANKNGMVYTTENPSGLSVQSLDLTSYKMKEQRITAFIKHEAPAQLLEIRTRSGKKVRVTSDHSLMALKRDGTIGAVKASDAAPGDFLPCPALMPLGGGFKTLELKDLLPDFRSTDDILHGLELISAGHSCAKAAAESGVDIGTLENWNWRGTTHAPRMLIARNLQQSLPSEIAIDSQFMRLAGAYLAEGHTEYDEEASRYSIKITNLDQAFVTEIRRCLDAVFPHFYHSYARKDIQINGKILSALFYRLFGSSAANKRIPDFFFSVDDNSLADFLMMYFEGDGWAYDDEVACSSKSRELLDGIQTSLSRWGIISIVRERIVKGQTYYDLNILQKHIPLFSSHIRFLTARKQKKLEAASHNVEERKKWDGIDVFPNIRPLLHSLITDYHLSARKNPRMRALAQQLRSYMDYENMGREKLKRTLNEICSVYGHKSEAFTKLERLANSDLFFDAITEIKRIPAESDYVYDLSVEGENFVAGTGNLIVHNSSILESISFALYGTFPALERRKLKLENIVRLNEPEAKVILEFDWDGSTYRAERSIERDKKGASSKAELYKDGSLLEHGPTAVTKHIETLMGIDYDLFTRAIYSEQNNIDYFLNLDPRRRKEEIDALLGLDRFETARANIISVINRLKSKRQGLEGQFSKDRLSSLEKEEQDRNTKLETTRTELAKSVVSYDKHRQDAETIQKAFEELRQKKEKADSLAKEEITLAAQHASLAKELEGKAVDETTLETLNSELKTLDAQRTELRQKLKQIEESLSRLSKETGAIDAKARSIAEAKSRLEKSKEEQRQLLAGKTQEQLETIQKDAEKSMLSLESERRSLERELAERSESLQKLKPGLSQCPLCLSKLSEGGLAHIKQEQESLISKAKARLVQLPALLAEQKKQADASQSALRRLSLISERIGALEKESKEDPALSERKKAIESELTTNEKQRNMVRETQDQLSVRMEATRAKAAELKSLLSKKAESSKLQARLEEVKRSLSQLNFDEKTYESSRTAAEHARLEAERALASKRALEKEAQHLSELAAAVSREIASLRSIQKDLALLSALEEQLSLYRNALLETQTSLRLSLADAINTAMNEIWGMLYPYKNYAALKLGVTDKDYLFEVEDRSGWHPLETMASGGERACAALALRISLAMVLTPKLGWLILDEPTHNLDTEAVEMLSSALQSRVPEVVRQTFVITHEERFMGSDFASSYRLKRDKEVDGSTVVEAM